MNEEDELQCDRTHDFDHRKSILFAIQPFQPSYLLLSDPNKRPKKRSASEPRPAGPPLRGIPFTISDVEPASPQNPDTSGSREKSALMDTDEFGHPPVTGAFEVSMKSVVDVIRHF